MLNCHRLSALFNLYGSVRASAPPAAKLAFAKAPERLEDVEEDHGEEEEQ